MTLNDEEKYLVENVVIGSNHKITTAEAKMLFRASIRHMNFTAVVLKPLAGKDRIISLLQHLRVCSNPPKCDNYVS